MGPVVPSLSVHLLGGPYVSADGRRMTVPDGGKRLLAFVALHGGPVERRKVAGVLWPVGTEDRAAGNLRSSLWRLRSAGIDVVDCARSSVSLIEDVWVNAEPLRESAQRALVSAHLGEGNWIEAHRALSAYLQVLADELGASPHSDLERIVAESAPTWR